MSGAFADDELDELNSTAWTIPVGWTAGNPGKCRSCGATVMWCTTPAGKRAPVDPDGKSHFATCPQADRWRKRT